MELRICCDASVKLEKMSNVMKVDCSVSGYEVNGDTLNGDIEIKGKYIRDVIEETYDFNETVPFTLVFKDKNYKINNIVVQDFTCQEIINQGIECNFNILVNYEQGKENNLEQPKRVEETRQKEPPKVEVVPAEFGQNEQLEEKKEQQKFIEKIKGLIPKKDKATSYDNKELEEQEADIEMKEAELEKQELELEKQEKELKKQKAMLQQKAKESLEPGKYDKELLDLEKKLSEIEKKEEDIKKKEAELDKQEKLIQKQEMASLKPGELDEELAEDEEEKAEEQEEEAETEEEEAEKEEEEAEKEEESLENLSPEELQEVKNDDEIKKQINKKYDELLNEILEARADENFLENDKITVKSDESRSDCRGFFRNLNENYSQYRVYYTSKESDIEKICKAEKVSVDKVYKDNKSTDFINKKRIIIK